MGSPVTASVEFSNTPEAFAVFSPFSLWVILWFLEGSQVTESFPSLGKRGAFDSGTTFWEQDFQQQCSMSSTSKPTAAPLIQ